MAVIPRTFHSVFTLSWISLFFFPGVVYYDDFLLQGEALCVRVCTKVEVTSFLTSFAPGRGGHILFRRMQTPKLMDGHSGCFPGFIVTREIVIHPLGEAAERPGPLFCSIFIFSWIQDTMKRLRAQLPWPSFEERWSKSLANSCPVSKVYRAVPGWGSRPYMVPSKKADCYFLWCIHTTYSYCLTSEDVTMTHSWLWVWMRWCQARGLNTLHDSKWYIY